MRNRVYPFPAAHFQDKKGNFITHCKEPGYFMKTKTFKNTIYACYRSSLTQGIVNNLSPLFFVIYKDKFNLSYTLIASLILFNFVTQLITDLVSVKYVDKLGYRKSALLAHILCVIGFCLMGLLPNLLPYPFVGLAIATIITGIGGGLIEVIASPMLDSIPGEAKASSMSLMHSFYCWGQLLVVILTTLILKAIGVEFWYFIPFLWALVPLYNFFTLFKVPLLPTIPDEHRTPLKSLFKSKLFIVALILMLAAGASEISMCQWSSLFAEKALGVPKVVGDLLGPALFAVFMGIGRVIFGIYGERLNLYKILLVSSVLCIGCYLGTALLQIPILSLICCSLCGLFVTLMWPGTISCTSPLFPKGGAAMFGLLALAGDMGCSVGPALVGTISDNIGPSFQSMMPGLTIDQVSLRIGMLGGIIFPVIMFVGIILLKKWSRGHQSDSVI